MGLQNSKYFAGGKHEPDDRMTLFCQKCRSFLNYSASFITVWTHKVKPRPLTVLLPPAVLIGAILSTSPPWLKGHASPGGPWNPSWLRGARDADVAPAPVSLCMLGEETHPKLFLLWILLLPVLPTSFTFPLWLLSAPHNHKHGDAAFSRRSPQETSHTRLFPPSNAIG